MTNQEIDLAVAKAVGFHPKDLGYNPYKPVRPFDALFEEYDSGVINGQVWIWRDQMRKRDFSPFCPSTDANDTLLAVELAGIGETACIDIRTRRDLVPMCNLIVNIGKSQQ